MSSYVEDTRYAVESLIQIIEHEQDDLTALMKLAHEQHQEAMAPAEGETRKRPDFRWIGTMVRADRERLAIDERLRADRRIVSLQAIAGTILQIARQGIASTHGGPARCPPGREIGHSVLRDVIWEGRNQAMHYDETPRRPVRDTFELLDCTFKEERFLLSRHVHENLALEVVRILGWHSFDHFAADMCNLLDPSPAGEVP